MIFEIGKTYRHNTGKRMTIIGRLKTHIYGECLIGECDTGELVPVGESEENAVNWHEQESKKLDNNDWRYDPNVFKNYLDKLINPIVERLQAESEDKE